MTQIMLESLTYRRVRGHPGDLVSLYLRTHLRYCRGYALAHAPLHLELDGRDLTEYVMKILTESAQENLAPKALGSWRFKIGDAYVE